MAGELTIPADPDYMIASASRLFGQLESFGGQVFYSPNLTSKNNEVKIARQEIVRQGRQLERGNELIRGGLDRRADMVIGATFRVHPQPDWEYLGITDDDVKKKIVAAFRREFQNWAYDTRLLQDGEGHNDFAGLMWLAVRNIAGPDGECAFVVHYDEERALAYGARWATYITLIDPDRIATPSELASDPNVFEGRRLDRDGRMLGMYVRVTNPNDSGFTGGRKDFTYVPRETNWGRPMGIHWFVKSRGGQQRGLSDLSTIISVAIKLGKFDDSNLASAVVNSQLATYIKTKSSPEVMAEALSPAPNSRLADGLATDSIAWMAAKVDYYGKMKFRVGPSRIPVLAPDDEIEMTSVNRSLDDPSPFRSAYLRPQASAVGNGSAQYSLNYSESNYSSTRAEELQVNRGVMRFRRQFSVPVPTQIYGAIIEEAIQRGRLPEIPAGAPPFQENRTAWISCAWTGPGMAQIDPQKEENANTAALSNRTTSRTRIAAGKGEDWYEIADELAMEESYAEEKGIELTDIMPGMDPTAGDDGGDPASAPTKKSGKKSAGGKPGRDADGDGQTDDRGTE